ncbi:MAG: hypothetical protein M3552_15620 [Planctomycetota bacterium]|nr:hypothetical protein [Planctomycetaceae bacterium]MDQ3332058.1 hypothetical protein [Planctomycetota bacterium]
MTVRISRFVGTTLTIIGLSMASDAAMGQMEGHSLPAPAESPVAPAPMSTDHGKAMAGSVASSFYTRPGAAVCPAPYMTQRGSCLPYYTPQPCGVGPADSCVNRPYTGFLFYGTDPRDDDPVNHTWTTCVGDKGNHAVRHTVRHVRRFGY